ncbi:MAG: GntR family transcriptional regulator [Nocardioidaceae bacterium]|nr:GntR family transcriptional regulator [Nocardioidaceae bacterium]
MSDVKKADDGRPPSLASRLEELWQRAAAAGEVMPGEPALAQALTASRPALREALVRLEERGYITRRQGADTAINRAMLDIPARLDEKVENGSLINAMGKESRVELLELRWDVATPEEVVEFGVDEGQEVLRTKKIWHADDTPVILAHDTIPLRASKLDKSTVDARMSVFELCELLGNPRADWETVWLGAAVLGEDAALMQGSPGDPVLSLDVTGITRSGGAGYWAAERHRSEAFRYAMIRSMARR